MPDDEAGTAGSPTDSPDDAGAVSDWTREWLEARAAEQGVPPGELLKRFAAAFRAAEEGEIPDLAFGEDVETLEAELATIESDLEALSQSVDDLDSDVEAKIQDVRERVIQVKREADAKASVEHDHPELAERLTAVAESADTTKSRLDELSAALDGLETNVSEGFSNFEEILEFLRDAVDDVEEKNTRLARALISMQETVDGMAEREGRRIAADRLREQANTHGIRTADCDDCGATLDIALLTDARCPHCASTFASLEPKRGFFGAPTLEVGDRPALEAADIDEPDIDALGTSGAVADGNGISTDLTDIAESRNAAEDDDITPGDAAREDDDE